MLCLRYHYFHERISMDYTIAMRHSTGRKHIYFSESKLGDILVFSMVADFFYCPGDRIVKISTTEFVFNSHFPCHCISIYYQGKRIKAAEAAYRNLLWGMFRMHIQSETVIQHVFLAYKKMKDIQMYTQQCERLTGPVSENVMEPRGVFGNEMGEIMRFIHRLIHHIWWCTEK